MTELLVETPIVESESSESISDQSQQVKMAVDPFFPSEGPPLDDTTLKESKNDTVQILFVTSESDELGENPLVPSQQEENPLVPATQRVISPVYLVPPPSSLVTFFDWN